MSGHHHISTLLMPLFQDFHEWKKSATMSLSSFDWNKRNGHQFPDFTVTARITPNLVCSLLMMCRPALAFRTPMTLKFLWHMGPGYWRQSQNYAHCMWGVYVLSHICGTLQPWTLTFLWHLLYPGCCPICVCGMAVGVGVYPHMLWTLRLWLFTCYL